MLVGNGNLYMVFFRMYWFYQQIAQRLINSDHFLMVYRILGHVYLTNYKFVCLKVE